MLFRSGGASLVHGSKACSPNMPWRNPIGFACDTGCGDHYGVAHEYTATSCKAGYLDGVTVLPSQNDNLLALVLLLAFHSHKFGVHFHIKPREKKVVSLEIFKQKCEFSKEHPLTLDLLVCINAMRERISEAFCYKGDPCSGIIPNSSVRPELETLISKALKQGMKNVQDVALQDTPLADCTTREEEVINVSDFQSDCANSNDSESDENSFFLLKPYNLHMFERNSEDKSKSFLSTNDSVPSGFVDDSINVKENAPEEDVLGSKKKKVKKVRFSVPCTAVVNVPSGSAETKNESISKLETLLQGEIFNHLAHHPGFCTLTSVRASSKVCEIVKTIEAQSETQFNWSHFLSNHETSIKVTRFSSGKRWLSLKENIFELHQSPDLFQTSFSANPEHIKDKEPERPKSISKEEGFLLGQVLENKQKHCGKLPKSTEKDRKSTRLNSSHANISYAVFCLKKKTKNQN